MSAEDFNSQTPAIHWGGSMGRESHRNTTHTHARPHAHTPTRTRARARLPVPPNLDFWKRAWQDPPKKQGCLSLRNPQNLWTKSKENAPKARKSLQGERQGNPKKQGLEGQGNVKCHRRSWILTSDLLVQQSSYVGMR